MNHLYVFLLLHFHLLLSMNTCINQFRHDLKDKEPTTFIKDMAFHISNEVIENTLKEEEEINIKRNHFLDFIKQNVNDIDAFKAMEWFFVVYKNMYYKYNNMYNKFLDTNNTPIFLTREVLSQAFSIFQETNQLKHKDKNKTLEFIFNIRESLLLNTLIYKNDLLHALYVIPKKQSKKNNDLVKIGFDLGVKTSITIFNIFRKKENSIKDHSETISNNNPLLPFIMKKISERALILDNGIFKPKEQSTDVQIRFLQSIFQPYVYETLPKFKTLSLGIQKRIINFLCCCKHYGKKNKVIIPKPVQALMLKKFVTYAHAQRTKDYLLAEVTLLNLGYLDGTENFDATIKEAMHFVKNNLLTWFDDQVRRL